VAGGEARCYACDIREEDAVKQTVASIVADFGRIDALVNNAGGQFAAPLESISARGWETVVRTNLTGGFLVARECYTQWMKNAGGGAIVNLGSISWHLGLSDLTVYQVAKAAIEGLTRSLARELGRDNIRVNTIVPGNVQTPRQMKWYTPEGEAEIVAAQCLDGRIQPSDIAAMAMFLASDDARYCTAHNYWVDAGWR